MDIVDVPIDRISIGERRRIDLGDIGALRSSIERLGLINPITITKEFDLVAGFRRLTCCRDLGLKVITARFFEDLDETGKKIVELEENIHEALTWDEVAMLRADIYELKMQEHGKSVKGHKTEGWSMEQAAKSMDLAAGTLSQDIKLANAMKSMPKLAKFASKRQALRALNKAKETAVLTELAKRDAMQSGQNVPYVLYNGDSYEFIKDKVDDETVDLVIFDPPWGIDINVIGASRGLGGEKTDYEDDSLVSAKTFTEQMLPELHRVMKPSTHMYMFTGTQFATYWIDFLSNTRTIMKPGKEPKVEVMQPNREWHFNVRKVPLIWVKEGGGFTDQEVKFMPRYEMMLFCNKGIRRLNSVCTDVFEFQRPLSTERIHTQQKPVNLLQLLVRLSSLPKEIVLDPTMGSGATIVAATLLGRRSIGIERQLDNYNKSLEWIRRTEFGLLEQEEIK